MASFVLVQGGGHGGWCYARVAKLLREAGHHPLAPSFTEPRAVADMLLQAAAAR